MNENILALMRLFEVAGYIQSEAWNALPKSGLKLIETLNPRQVKAMVILATRRVSDQPPLSLNQLAAFLNMKKAATSHLVSDLAEKKLVLRTVDPDNRRYIRITLAPRGIRLAGAISTSVFQKLEEFLQAVSAEELKAMTGFSEKIYALYSRKVESAQ